MLIKNAPKLEFCGLYGCLMIDSWQRSYGESYETFACQMHTSSYCVQKYFCRTINNARIDLAFKIIIQRQNTYLTDKLFTVEP